MGKTYWVMKTPSNAAEWVEMDGEQFYEFINSPVGKDRYFMDCDTYKIEVSKEQYRNWKIEKNHSSYLQRFEAEVVIWSLDSIGENNPLLNNDTIINLSLNVEDNVISEIELSELFEAFKSLTADERKLIHNLFLCDKPKTEQSLADHLGIPHITVHKKKTTTLKKLKLLVTKSKKGQQ